MAALSFPPDPTNGQYYPSTPLAGESQYQWDAAKQTWRLVGTATGVVADTYGDATNVGQFTVNAAGQITEAQNVPLAAPIIVPVPATSGDPGNNGEVAFDGAGNFYFYQDGSWFRVAGVTF